MVDTSSFNLSSPFSACLTPQHDATVATATETFKRPSLLSKSRPPRPHTTSHAAVASSSFFPPSAAEACTSHPLWKDIRELGHDVKDGLHGLKEVWLQQSQSSSSKKRSSLHPGCGDTFFDDLSEFVEPHFESLGIVDPDPTRANGNGKGNAKFFTFDKMERLLNYCVPLAVDPRSPKSRARDSGAEEEDDVHAASEDEEREEEDDDLTTALQDRDRMEENVDLSDAGVPSHQGDVLLLDRSNESLPEFSGGLLEHTNRLRETMMNRSRHRTRGVHTTPARMLRRSSSKPRGIVSTGSNSSSGSENEARENKRNRIQNRSDTNLKEGAMANAVVVPGGLWSLPSNEERYSTSLEESFTASHSTQSSGSESGNVRLGVKNAYYCGSEKDLDDVLLMRSMEDEGDASKSYGDVVTFPSSRGDQPSGSEEEVYGSMKSEEADEYYANIMQNAFQEASNSLERVDVGPRRKMTLVLDTGLGFEEREDNDEVVRTAMNAINDLTSPRSLASDDKYMLDDDQVQEEETGTPRDFNDPYADTHELSHYRRKETHATDRQPFVSCEAVSDARDGEPGRDQGTDQEVSNDAVNRHFDNLISSFELSLDREGKEQSSSVYEKLKKYQMQKKIVKHSRQRKVQAQEESITKSPAASRGNDEDDVASKASNMSNQSTASFLQDTTMGRKLNRSAPPSPGSIASSKESVIHRARKAVTQVHQVIESMSKNDEVKAEKSNASEGNTGGKDLFTQAKPPEIVRSKSGESLVRSPGQGSSISSYRKRLLEQRDSRSFQSDLTSSKGKSNDGFEEPLQRENVQTNPRCEKESPVKCVTLDTLLQDSTELLQENNDDAILDSCGSGVKSFDSSVNWDALAYSMSGSLSLQEQQSPQQDQMSLPAHDGIKAPDHSVPVQMLSYGNHDSQHSKPEPVVAISPIMNRIEQIKKRHDEEIAKIQTHSPTKSGYHPEDDAPEDEYFGDITMNPASEEENQHISPNHEKLRSNVDYSSPKSIKSPVSESNVQKRIDLMKQQVELNSENLYENFGDKEKQHIAECVGLWKMNSKKFEKVKGNTPAATRQMTSRFNFDVGIQRSPKKASTEDLLLKNLELEQEMNQLRMLSPKSRESWSSPLSTRSKRYAVGDLQGRSPSSNPLSHSESPRSNADTNNKARHYTSSQLRNNERECQLKVEIPVSPASPPALKSWSSTSPSNVMLKSHLTPQEDRVRTRVSELMAEVKGFLAENDRARQRIARDMEALQNF